MSWLISILRDVRDSRSGNATRRELTDILNEFAEDPEKLSRESLDLENGLPSHDWRLFCRLDPEALSGCFGPLLDALGEDGAGVVAIDGKTLRRSFDRAKGTSALHVVMAFATEARLVIDAIHCNAETARKVLDRGGNSLFTLKANRPALKGVETYLARSILGQMRQPC